MTILLGDSTAANYAVTTNTYAAANGEWFYPLVAIEDGMVNTLWIRMSSFNTTTSLKLLVRNSSGVLLGSGNIASSGGDSGARSVAVTPFAITGGATYYVSIIANTGSPCPMQNTVTNTVDYQASSTYASPAAPLTIPGTDSAVRQFHMWAEGDLTIAITDVNGDETIVVGDTTNTATTTGFSESITDASIDGISCTSVVDTAGTVTFSVPSFTDGATYPEVDSAQDLLLEGATQSAVLEVQLLPPDGYASIAISSPVTADNTYAGSEVTTVPGDRWVFPKELPEGFEDVPGNYGFNIEADTKIITTSPGTRVVWKWSNSDSTMTRINLTINEFGEIVSIVNQSMISIVVYGAMMQVMK